MKRLHYIAAALLALMLAFGGTAFAAHQYGKGQVNVNTATRDQLVWFLGQSNVSNPQRIADNILAYRDANGPFEKVTDLKKVKGINDEVFSAISYRVKVSGKTDYDPEAVTPSPGHPKERDDMHESS